MIYLIFTCSLYNKYIIDIEKSEYDLSVRENLYKTAIVNNLLILKNYIDSGIIKPIIVENNGYRTTILDTIGIPVLYTNSNNFKFGCKGVNEFCDFFSVIHNFNINDNDIFIKITGRYILKSDSFFRMLIDNQDKYDIFAKFFNVCTKEFCSKDIILGLCGIRVKYLKDFKIEPSWRGLEMPFAIFCRENISSDRFLEYTNLDLKCKFADYQVYDDF
jgi:hypothetical protein